MTWFGQWASLFLTLSQYVYLSHFTLSLSLFLFDTLFLFAILPIILTCPPNWSFQIHCHVEISRKPSL